VFIEEISTILLIYFEQPVVLHIDRKRLLVMRVAKSTSAVSLIPQSHCASHSL